MIPGITYVRHRIIYQVPSGMISTISAISSFPSVATGGKVKYSPSRDVATICVIR